MTTNPTTQDNNTPNIEDTPHIPTKPVTPIVINNYEETLPHTHVSQNITVRKKNKNPTTIQNTIQQETPKLQKF